MKNTTKAELFSHNISEWSSNMLWNACTLSQWSIQIWAEVSKKKKGQAMSPPAGWKAQCTSWATANEGPVATGWQLTLKKGRLSMNHTKKKSFLPCKKVWIRPTAGHIHSVITTWRHFLHFSYICKAPLLFKLMPEMLLELWVLTAERKDDSTILSLQSFSYLLWQSRMALPEMTQRLPQLTDLNKTRHLKTPPQALRNTNRSDCVTSM